MQREPAGHAAQMKETIAFQECMHASILGGIRSGHISGTIVPLPDQPGHRLAWNLLRTFPLGFPNRKWGEKNIQLSIVIINVGNAQKLYVHVEILVIA